MSAGEGKGWARGKTAASDARIANNAAAHRGRRYVRHVAPELDRRLLNGQGLIGIRTLPLEWSPTMAYVVGLMATDGCLISGRKQLNFKSEDAQLVETFLHCLGRPLTYRPARTKLGRLVYVSQFGDARFYEWLQEIGLTPRKSLVLGPVAVPDAFVLDCARGLLDGDGSLLNYWYDGGGKARGHRYEGLRTVFNSASEAHLVWLRAALARVLKIEGALRAERPNEHGTVMWKLAYAIRESTILLPGIYPTNDVPRLIRKWRVWLDYAARHGLRADGRTISEIGVAYEVA